MNADEITGELVHLLLRRHRLGQADLGQVLGISSAAVGRKLYGTRSWTLDELLATAQFFDVPVTELLPGNGYAPVLSGRGRTGELVRPKGLEPPTFWSVAEWSAEDDAALEAHIKATAVEL